MNLKELIKDTNLLDIEESLIKLYQTSDDILVSYEEMFYKLEKIEPINSKMRICIEYVQPDGTYFDEGYWDVHGEDGSLIKDSSNFQYFKDNITEEEANKEQRYAIEFTAWNEILGMEIDIDTLNNINLMKSDIIALLLFEMSFIGFDENEIKKRAEELNQRVEQIKNMSEEEIEKNTISLDEIKKHFDDLKGDENEEI